MPKPETGKLAALAADIARCRICRDAPEGAPLPHEPRPVVRPSMSARLCIAGQAPGTRVHASGMPFTDPSGDRLRAWLGIAPEVFYDAEKVAIVPMGFCFPGLDKNGGDLPPRPECRKRWHDALFAAMPQIELTLVIGQYAQAYHLGAERSRRLTDTVADWQRLYQRPGLPRYIPLPHPSWRNNGWLRKNPWFSDTLLPLLRAEVARLVG